MRQKLGQHFLINPEVSANIAAAIDPNENDTVLEVGPGHGELTEEIISRIQQGNIGGVKMILIEKDTELAEELRQTFKSFEFLKVIEDDILKFLSQPESLKMLGDNYKIVGNLPYYLTGHLLRIISELETKPRLSVFMVQKEVAERMAAKESYTNRLSASVQFWSKPEVVMKVPRTDFNPPPEVDSAVVLLRPRDEMKPEEARKFYNMARMAFAQPRKTIFNNLRSIQNAEKLLEECGIDPKSRPQDLSLEKIEELARRME